MCVGRESLHATYIRAFLVLKARHSLGLGLVEEDTI